MNENYPLNFSYEVYESTNGTDESLNPVIFIHGVLGSKDMWDDIPQIIADKTKRKTYAYDARNHGDTDFSNVFSFDLNIDDLFYFMDTLNISTAILVGHSMGGYTACRAALKNPERIEMFFSEDMYAKKLMEDIVDQIIGFAELLIDAIEGLPSSMEGKEAQKYVFDKMFSQASPDAVYTKEKENLIRTKFLLKRKPDGSHDISFNKDTILRALKNYDTLMSDPRGVYEGPAYYLYGTRSFMNVGSEEENIKLHFPNVEFIKFEEATHNVHVEFSEKFVDTILDRLTKHN